MSETLTVSPGGKSEKYMELLPQLRAMVEAETDAIACMANVAAAIRETFGFWWVGFYRVVGDCLVLGPFQGPVACTRIARRRGVCGTAWYERRTLIVPDVERFPGHIACSSASRSEIVIPLMADGEVAAVLDIDSRHPDDFDQTDAQHLGIIADLVATRLCLPG